MANRTTFIFTESDGGKLHLVSGKFHREDGPAIVRADHQEWYQNGILHREDGPARMFLKTKVVEFWTEGKFITSGLITNDEQFQKWLGK